MAAKDEQRINGGGHNGLLFGARSAPYALHSYMPANRSVGSPANGLTGKPANGKSGEPPAIFLPETTGLY
jgi:hypothetical protein